MVKDVELIGNEEYSRASYLSSFEDKYFIFDNLNQKSEPIIKQRDDYYNNLYVTVIVVLNGALNITVNSNDIHIHSNEYLTIMPCSKFRINESKCIFFAYCTQAYLINSIYSQMGIKRDWHVHCFTFHHHKLGHEQIQRLKSVYLRAKKEHNRPNHKLKEFAIRSSLMAYYSQILTFIEENNEIKYNKNTRQEEFFKDFLYLLDINYATNRSVNFYAEKLHISPKYLSSITISHTGISASKIIEDYVVFQIKQQLYTNTKSIKEISKELNFQSQSFFGRYFKRVTGMSPREYTNKYAIKFA
jgi:AraC-like DNA-binding protein